MLDLVVRIRPGPLQPALVLGPHPLRLGQKLTHVFPHRGVQDIGADLLVPAQALAAEAIGVGAGAAVVGVGDLALGRGPAHRLAVAAVAAPLADDQPLKQVTTTTGPVTTALPILLELSLNGCEERLTHQPRNIYEDLIVR